MPQISQELYDAILAWDGSIAPRDEKITTQRNEYIATRLAFLEDLQTPKQRTAQLAENNIFAMFDRAQSQIKFPRLRFPLAPGINRQNKLVLHMAGKKSQYEGAIMMTDGGEYGANNYYGRISRGENDQPVPMWARECPQTVKSIVTAILADPLDSVKFSGLTYKHCCFCGRGLENDNSLTVGYGPICAEKWGLPWEGTAEQARLAAQTDGEDC